MADRLGLGTGQLEEIQLAAGFEPVDPSLPIFLDSDVEAFGVLLGGMLFFSWPELVSFTRVMGSAMGRIADAATALFATDVAQPMVEAGASDIDVEERGLQATLLAGDLSNLFDTFFRLHLSQSTERSQVARAGGAIGAVVTMAVGFIDLVGFTPRTLAMETGALAALVSRFEAVAHDTVTARRGRLVKLIGDEVMYVAVTPSDGSRIAEALLEVFGSDSALTPRGGLAYGEVLTRGGDFFGPTVNLASRLADQAVPGEVLMSEAAAVAAHRSVESAGRRMLKGFEQPVTVASLVIG